MKKLFFIKNVMIIMLLLNNFVVSGEHAQFRRVDELFTQWEKPDSPGCVIAIIKNGRIIYKQSYGMADLERQVQLSTQSIFDISSLSKQFTAMCVVLLEKRKKISLDDDIRKYISELPDYGEKITIKHLIHHTSGLRDYIDLMFLAGMNNQKHHSEASIIQLLSRQSKLNFKPGEKFQYNNTGYFLLGVIVKRVSKKTLAEFAEENIFKILKMKHTHYCIQYNGLVKNRAVGYSKGEKGKFLTEFNFYNTTGDGGILTSVDDLFLWDQNFYKNKLNGGDLTIVDQILSTGELNNGTKLNYAFGLFIEKHRGLDVIRHDGVESGYRSEMIRFRDQNFSVICLSNFQDFNPTYLAKQIADIFLADQLKVESHETKLPENSGLQFITLSESELKKKTGVFRNPQTGQVLKIYTQQEKLIANYGDVLTFEIRPVSEKTFMSIDAPVSININFEKKQGDQGSCIHVKADGREYVFESMELSTLSISKLDEYIGDYHNRELDTTYRIFVKDKKLFLRIKNYSDPFLMKPTLADEFTVIGMTLKFVRDSTRDIHEFNLNAGRVNNVIFKKKNALEFNEAEKRKLKKIDNKIKNLKTEREKFIKEFPDADIDVPFHISFFGGLFTFPKLNQIQKQLKKLRDKTSVIDKKIARLEQIQKHIIEYRMKSILLGAIQWPEKRDRDSDF